MPKIRKRPQDYVSGRPTSDSVNPKVYKTPTGNVKENVNFNPNNTVTIVDQTGKAATLTKAEYQKRNDIEMGRGGYTHQEAANLMAKPLPMPSTEEMLYNRAVEQAKFEAAKNEVLTQIQENKLAAATAEKQGAVDQIGVLTPEQQATAQANVEGSFNNPYETASAGLAGASGAVSAGLAVPALATKLGIIGSAAGPAGTAIGIGAGLVGGVTAYYTKVGFAKHGDVKVANAIGTGSVRNMAWAINQANSGNFRNITVAEEFWDNQEANLEASLMGLKKLSATKKEQFLSGGLDDYSKMLAISERLPMLRQNFKDAMLNPNPNAMITEEDIKILLNE